MDCLQILGTVLWVLHVIDAASLIIGTTIILIVQLGKLRHTVIS